MFKLFVITLISLTTAFAETDPLFEEVEGREYNFIKYQSEKNVKYLDFLELCTMVATFEYSTQILRLHFEIQSEDKANKEDEKAFGQDFLDTLETIQFSAQINLSRPESEEWVNKEEGKVVVHDISKANFFQYGMITKQVQCNIEVELHTDYKGHQHKG